MKVRLVPIGNSRGIRIPKAVLEQCGFSDTATLLVEDNRIVIAPTRALREGWKDAFESAGAATDKELLLGDSMVNEFDCKDWEW
jgi:antitoxin MazE